MSLVKNSREYNIIMVCVYNDSVTLFCTKDNNFEAGGAEANTRTNGGRGVGGLLSVKGIGISPEKPCWMFRWLDLTHCLRINKKTHGSCNQSFNVHICLSVFTDCCQTMLRIGLCTMS